jgi:hypothetical protein
MSAFLSSITNNIPSLRLRKDIWTHFPVCLIKLPTEDGRDRYAVQWHQKNLTEWSQGIPHYPLITQHRLLSALKQSDKWSLENPKTPADLCVIAMKFSESPKPLAYVPNLFAHPSVIGDIKDIEDLKHYFPVCWKSSHNRYVLEFHNTWVRAIAEKENLTEFEVHTLTLQKLKVALTCHWNLQPTSKQNSQEICVITRK